MESKTKEYAGIDVFRVVAAVLVAAIHISPLASYNELADMALTKIAARTAVPFFFMTTGFFLLGGKDDERRRYEHLKLGVAVTGWLLYTFGMKATWKCVLVLYLAGLLGDSYYGISHNLPIVRSVYEMIFHVCDYTRNGLERENLDHKKEGQL